MESTIRKILNELMNHEEFGFSVLHYSNDRDGYVQGFKNGMVNPYKVEYGEYICFTHQKQEGNSRESIKEFRLSLCDWFNENYPDYQPNFQFENTSEEDEILEIKRDDFLIYLTLPKEVQIMENLQSIRNTMIDYIVKHPYFDNNVDLDNIHFGGYLSKGENDWYFDNGTHRFLIDDVDTDTLYKIVNYLKYSNE